MREPYCISPDPASTSVDRKRRNYEEAEEAFYESVRLAAR